MTRRPAAAPRLSAFVRAAALDAPQAREAWATWRGLAGGAPLLPAEEQLAATVHQTLQGAGFDPEDLAQLRPYRDRARLAARLRRPAYRAILEALQRAGIDACVLKGLALAECFYADPTVRRTGDLDLLIPESAHADALRVLRARGWDFVAGGAATFDPRFLHAAQLVDERGLSVDLHCHLLPVACGPDAERLLWAETRRIALDDLPVTTLCATDHLLHVIVHGQIAGPVQPVRWLVDASRILRAPGVAVDWDRFVQVARHLGVTTFARAGLAELERCLGLGPAPGVHEHLAAARPAFAERLLFRATGRVPRGPLDAVRMHVGRFLRGTVDLPGPRRLRLAGPYLRAWLGVSGWGRVSRELLGRTARSVAVRLRLARPSVMLNRRTMGSNARELEARLDASGRWASG